AIPGAVLAAAYMLRMLQKVVWGGAKNPAPHGGLLDLNMREIVTLAPLLLFVFWIGLAPAPFMEVMHVSVAHLVDQVSNTVPVQAVTMAGVLLP
ncbi:MAG TPA: NADH-quinone oxidoreductase subunit M, partial [Desulfurivibrionaceae bacterium]|nr:NADH-quinone oxidoreductase subunit M [Desulfurivibrionaceae bacterium]